MADKEKTKLYDRLDFCDHFIVYTRLQDEIIKALQYMKTLNFSPAEWNNNLRESLLTGLLNINLACAECLINLKNISDVDTLNGGVRRREGGVLYVRYKQR